MNFEKLAYNVKDKLFRFSFRIVGSKDEAEDIVQEVFEKIWTRRDSMHEVLNPEAYCMTLAKNLSLDKLKTKHRQTVNIDEAFSIKDSESTPYRVAETNDTFEKIRQIMLGLPEKQRMVMHLRDIEGLSYDEISTALEMPMPQVKVYLHRARMAVKEKLDASFKFEN